MKEKSSLSIFIKVNWVKLVLILCSFIVVIVLSIYFISNLPEKVEFKSEALEDYSPNGVFSLSKAYLYSSATGANNSETKAMWDLNISQYTDIALYLDILNVNEELTNKLIETKNIENENLQVVELSDKNTISKIYIDNISFSNTDTGDLSLNYIPFANFTKLADDELETLKQTPSKIEFNVVDSPQITYDGAFIDKDLKLPITLRYFNYNLKTNHIVNNIEEPLAFNGSILKRAGITLSSIKNEVSFTIHILNKLGEEYKMPVHLQIPLQNTDNSKNIYDGFYEETLNY